MVSMASGSRWRTVPLMVGTLLGAIVSSVGAQGATMNNPPNTQEFGVDAGAIIGLGDQSSLNFSLPAARARIGFFLNNDSRWSIEPAAGFSYTKVEDVPYTFAYNLEVGALRHFRPPSELFSATRASVAYLRPFVGLTGVRSGGSDTEDNSDSEVSAGVGVGIKVPWRAGLAWRFEANTGYGFDNEAFRLGAFVGVSFFARDVIPTGGR